MSYRKEVFNEVVKQHSKIFGRDPTVFERLSLRWQLRNWSYERLLEGLVVMNIHAVQSQ